MGNHKPRSKSDRIPIASLTPRQTMQVDPVPNREATLAIPPLAADEREARSFKAVRAVAFVHGQQPETPETIAASGELLDALGLLDGRRKQRPRVTVDSVPCEQCRARPGQPCVASTGSEYRKGHQGRRRAAQELREAGA